MILSQKARFIKFDDKIILSSFKSSLCFDGWGIRKELQFEEISGKKEEFSSWRQNVFEEISCKKEEFFCLKKKFDWRNFL